MDSNTVKFLKEMDRLGGNNLDEAVRAESMGYPVPFTTVEFLVMDKPSAPQVPGQSLKMILQLRQSPDLNEVGRLKNLAWEMAKDAFRQEPAYVNEQVMRYFDPREWGQYLNG